MVARMVHRAWGQWVAYVRSHCYFYHASFMHSASMLSKGDCLSICLYVCPSQSRSIYMQQCVWSGCTYNTSSLTQTFWCYKVPTVTKDVGNKHRLGAITYDFWWISYCLAKMTQDRAIDRGIWLNTQICIVLKNHDVFVWNMYYFYCTDQTVADWQMNFLEPEFCHVGRRLGFVMIFVVVL